jgi:C_GCAxxG_C_C family probable redox protein
MDRVEMALSRFAAGFNCAQAILSVYAKQFGLDEALALKIAAGFGGGMGLAETCGAVTGAMMVLGLKYGATSADDPASKEPAYQQVRQFASRFQARNASLLCRELLGCDISSAQGLELARQQNLFSTTCPKFVRAAAEILEEML